jgi:hypothetical protein
MTFEINSIYIIDSSSLIHLRSINPIDIYITPWNNLKKLIEDRRLITHSEVKDEVTDGDDFLVDWVKEQDKKYDWVYGITEYQNMLLPDIHRKYPHFIKPENEHDADPFIVALALEEIKNPPPQTVLFSKNEYIVVSNEKSAKNRNLKNPHEVVKIPDFCEIFEIKCISLFEMFRRENWKF